MISIIYYDTIFAMIIKRFYMERFSSIFHGETK